MPANSKPPKRNVCRLTIPPTRGGGPSAILPGASTAAGVVAAADAPDTCACPGAGCSFCRAGEVLSASAGAAAAADSTGEPDPEIGAADASASLPLVSVATD